VLSNLKRKLRNTFIAGLLVTIPIAFTLFILNFLFKKLDSALSPAFTNMLIFFGIPISVDFRIPGVGVMMTVLIIFLMGLLATNIFGRELVKLGEMIVEKIPVVRSIYTGTKQVAQTILDAEIETFREVVMLEFPRKGLWALGFITCANKGEIQYKTGSEILNVFVPTTPNPTSGFLVFVPKNQVIELSMTIEEGLKFAISGGIIAPPYSSSDSKKKVEVQSTEKLRSSVET
tara:strand:+ start:4737 stop:5432 length:696 start_codon:yes stop_codon:yes gene_type:complete